MPKCPGQIISLAQLYMLLTCTKIAYSDFTEHNELCIVCIGTFLKSNRACIISCLEDQHHLDQGSPNYRGSSTILRKCLCFHMTTIQFKRCVQSKAMIKLAQMDRQLSGIDRQWDCYSEICFDSHSLLTVSNIMYLTLFFLFHSGGKHHAYMK